MKQDKYKQLIIDTLNELVEAKLISVYAFVIMPNHIHLIWELLTKNGNEMPHASFNKKTAHEITKDLKINHPQVLPYFEVNEKERQFRIWQREPLAILIDTKIKFEQKMDYIHNNPLNDKWNLAKRPEEFKWSSSRFYEDGFDEFGILTHYYERFS